MLSLPNVTLMVADCVDAERALRSLERCVAVCNYGAVKLLTSKAIPSPYRVGIMPIKTHYEYSEFMLLESFKYCDTTHMQIVQHDSWILHPESWDPAWLSYDYVGGICWAEAQPIRETAVLNGGFSLRTRKLMRFVAENVGPYRDAIKNYGTPHEDGIICDKMGAGLREWGFTFAPPESAARYSYEGNSAYFCPEPFGFHGGQWLEMLPK
jgi:hypothetical protein